MEAIVNRSQKTGADALMWIMSVVLVGYTAFRSTHLVQMTLPPGAEIVGYFALMGLDVALFVWLLYALHGARTALQTWVSIVMVYVQIMGIAATAIADTVLTFQPDSAPAMIYQVAMWFIPIVIAINILSATTCKLMSHARQERQAGYEMEDTMAEQVAALMRQNSPIFASAMTPHVAAARMKSMMAQYGASALLQAGQQAQPAPADDPLFAEVMARMAAQAQTQAEKPNGHAVASSRPFGLSRRPAAVVPTAPADDRTQG